LILCTVTIGCGTSAKPKTDSERLAAAEKEAADEKAAEKKAAEKEAAEKEAAEEKAAEEKAAKKRAADEKAAANSYVPAPGSGPALPRTGPPAAPAAC
jgi:hypothetical protein